MPSFKERLKAKAEAVQVREVEAARLGAMPLDELAAMLMPAFGPDQKKADSSWVNPGKRGGTNEELLLDLIPRPYEVFPIRPKPWSLLRARVLEAVQVLEHAGLVYVLWISEQGGRHWNATEAGLAALANNNVRQRIQGSRAPRPQHRRLRRFRPPSDCRSWRHCVPPGRSATNNTRQAGEIIENVKYLGVAG